MGILTDIAHNLEAEAMLPYCNDLMNMLVQTLTRQDVHRDIKPHIIGVFGDLCALIGAKFMPYLPIVHQMLLQAMELSVQLVSGGGNGGAPRCLLMHGTTATPCASGPCILGGAWAPG